MLCGWMYCYNITLFKGLYQQRTICRHSLFQYWCFWNSIEKWYFFSIIEADFSCKDERVKLDTKLTSYLFECYNISLDDISDSYVENIIQDRKNPLLCDMLGERYVQKDEVTIDCSNIFSYDELIEIVKSKLEFPICRNLSALPTRRKMKRTIP